MNTDNENWYEGSKEENQDTGRDGNSNRDDNRDGYNRRDDNRSSYNRDNRQSRSYGDRPQRTSYNKYGNNNDRSGYNRSDRQQRSYNRDENFQRPYNRDYNRDDSSTGYNREGGERPYRPRFNREDGEQRSYNRGDRPQRSYNPNYNRENSGYNRGGSNYNRDNQGYNRDNQGYNRDNQGYNRGSSDYNRGSEDGNRPRRRITTGGSSYGGGSNYGGGSSYGNRSNSDRPRRPRFTPEDDKPQGFARPVRRTGGDYDPNAKYSRKKQIEYKEQFVDPNEPIRLNKYLANAGVCSRREADEFITSGTVTVNGEVVTELGTKIKRTDEVKFNDQAVSIERKVYILLNKPKNCVTTSDDPQERHTVMDLVKGACNERIYPVGRLDRNTTGVLLLTNDGDLASKLTHPKFLKKKIYQVTTERNVTRSDMEQVMTGLKLDEEIEIKADAINYADEVKRNVVGIEIHSGQNRIVRRIFETLGYRVMKLDRVYFAGLTKKGLRRGDWRYLTENEVNYLRMGSFT